MLYCATSSVDATGGPFSEGYRQAGGDGEHARCSPCDHLRHPRRPRHPVCYRAAAEQVSQESAEQHAPQGWNGEFWFVWFGLVWFGDHPPTTGDVVCGTCTCANSARLPPLPSSINPFFFVELYAAVLMYYSLHLTSGMLCLYLVVCYRYM